ncbi:hypothetical protein [Streptomyces sp. NBC_00019]|uniref:hypothetical protein n=1 Tax=Streptomyces sp. NBC_00019 TaxID=2975623 RepID=UPI0032522DA4
MTEPPAPATRLHPPLVDDRHLPVSWVTAYAGGRLDAGLLGRAEPHLRHCRRCAEAVNDAVRNGPHQARLDALHTVLLNRIGGGPRTGPMPPPTPGIAPRTGPAPRLAATQGLRLSWIVAVVCVSALGVGLARTVDSSMPRLLLLLFAPTLPMLCVAGSYGGRVDPFAEVTRTTPAGGLRILLLRTTQLLVVCVPLVTGVAALMPGASSSPWTSAGWLLPCLAVTLATLLLSSCLGSWAASLVTGCGWLLLVYVLAKPLTEHRDGSLAHRVTEALTTLQLQFIDTLGTLVFGAVSAVLAELLVLRRHAFSRPGAR